MLRYEMNKKEGDIYMERDLTTGSIGKNILKFSLPYFLAYFLQTLYGMADLFIIGQFDSVAGTTAVSVGSQVMHMITVMIVGIAMGTTVMIGKSVGAKQKKETSKIIGNTITLFLGISITLTVVLLFFVNMIVNVMSTPAQAVNGTKMYLTICFAGIPLITAYNIISSIFRGLGDSKSPMYFIAIACFANIILDYLFIGGLHFGAAGAALGTTIAQTISVVIALLAVFKKNTGISVKKTDLKPHKKTLKDILQIGVPISLQDGFIQISFIIITIIANQRGLNDAAAVGIVEKIISFVFLVPSSMLSSVSAISAQNIGAGKDGRALKTLKYATAIAVVFGLTVAVCMQFISNSVVGIFSHDPTVIKMGSQYITSYIWDCMLAGIHFSFSGYFCAYGKSGISFLHNVLSIVFIRVPGAFLTSKLFANTLYPMGVAAPCGSLLSVIICVIALYYLRNVKKQIPM